MPARFVAFLLSCALLWSGLNAQESFDASLFSGRDDVQTSMSDSPAFDDRSGIIEDRSLDGLPSSADLVEHAVWPAAPDLSGTGLTMSLSQRTGMADVRSPLVDGLLRPPCVVPARA
ncbi:hypothetical protein M8A51_25780 [Schlegelella sp. S2-27]|uniref:Uncharacterized protein n=1 Tax=Caldimonas mangrovi TaxID=2944811 RepID=A0ABT0YW21_9BURK|nr:hypothetical protein [Caldimonas mangrovi]